MEAEMVDVRKEDAVLDKFSFPFSPVSSNKPLMTISSVTKRTGSGEVGLCYRPDDPERPPARVEPRLLSQSISAA